MLENPEPGFVWLKIPLNGETRVTVCGEVHTWWSHWHRVPGLRHAQAVRCRRAMGVTCDWCEAGAERRARYVFPVLVEGELRVVELGRVQFSVLRLLHEEGRWLGQKLTLRRAFAAKNAEIVLIPAGRESVSDEATVDVEQFVANLGVGQLRLVDPPRRETPALERTLPSERTQSEPAQSVAKRHLQTPP